MCLSNSQIIILMIIQSITWRTTVNLITVMTFLMYLFEVGIAELHCYYKNYPVYWNADTYLKICLWIMQAEHMDNSRGLLLFSLPFSNIWSVCLGLEWVSGLCNCWCLRSLPPPRVLMSDTLMTPWRNATENSFSLSF